MKKVLASLFLISTLLTACGESSLINQEDNINQSYISSSKSSRNIFSTIEKVNAEYKKRNPEIINIKYQAMSESPFAFYRATAYLFYADALKNSFLNSINVNIQGDLHLDNVGTYFASNGKVYYDLNDFDDAYTGSYLYDVSRCATSIYLAAADAGYNINDSEDIAKEFLNAYADSLKSYSSGKNAINQPVTSLSKYAQKAVDKTNQNSYSSFLNEISANGKFIYSDKIRKVSPEIFNNVSEALKNSNTKTKNNLKVKDIGIYIAGKGSLGRYRYIILTEGESTKSNDDLVFDLKEAGQPSASQVRSKLSGNQAQRIVGATKYFISYPDTYLGTTNIKDIDFYLRKVSPDEKVNTKKIDKESDFKDHVKTVAKIVAKAHAISGKTAEIISDFEKKKDLVNSFSKDYSNQVKEDFNEFKKSF